MIGKIDKIEQALRNAKGIDGYILDMKGLCIFPTANLLEKFKMPEIEKFDGTGDPTIHQGIFVSSVVPLGLTEEQMGQLFPRTLSGMALRWLMKLDKSETRTWEDIGSLGLHSWPNTLTINSWTLPPATWKLLVKVRKRLFSSS